MIAQELSGADFEKLTAGVGSALFQVLNALAGDRFRIGGVIKDFHAHPAAVIGLFQGAEDRHEIHAAKTRPALVRIVGVKMRRARGMPADQLGNRRFVAGHRLGIEMQHEIRMGNSIEEFNAFGAGDDKVRIRLGERGSL